MALLTGHVHRDFTTDLPGYAAEPLGRSRPRLYGPHIAPGSHFPPLLDESYGILLQKSVSTSSRPAQSRSSPRQERHGAQLRLDAALRHGQRAPEAHGPALGLGDGLLGHRRGAVLDVGCRRGRLPRLGRSPLSN